MKKPALSVIAFLLALTIAGPVEAGLARRCKRLCKELIAFCIESAGCSALATRPERRTCKRSCKQPIIEACKLDQSACPQGSTTTSSTATSITMLTTTTTTTIPSPGSCPTYSSACQETADSSAIGLGDHACVDGPGDLPLDSTTVFVSVDAVDAANASVNVNVTSADFSASILCEGPSASVGGSLVIEKIGGDPAGTAGCCVAGQTRILRCRTTVDRICAVGEDITGSFEIDAECVGGTSCSTRVTYLVARDG